MNRARPHAEPAEVLLVEDNRPDARLIVEILQQGGVPIRVSVATDGDEALDVLHRRGEHAGAARPILVVLDLNLPGCDGRDVLRGIKGDSSLRDIPVVILTTSDAPVDIQQAYDLQANAYIVKPVGLDEFTAVIRSIGQFWLSIAQPPGPRRRIGA